MKAHTLFAMLVGCQALHSTEETVFGLYHRLPHISWADAVFRGGALTLFVSVNAAFVAFGVWCYLARVRPGAATAGALVYGWVLVEILNGLLHPAWSILSGHYVPGTATAPVLLLLALALTRTWTLERRVPPAG